MADDVVEKIKAAQGKSKAKDKPVEDKPTEKPVVEDKPVAEDKPVVEDKPVEDAPGTGTAEPVAFIATLINIPANITVVGELLEWSERTAGLRNGTIYRGSAVSSFQGVFGQKVADFERGTFAFDAMVHNKEAE